jgi:hypothetical protein
MIGMSSQAKLPTLPNDRDVPLEKFDTIEGVQINLIVLIEISSNSSETCLITKYPNQIEVFTSIQIPQPYLSSQLYLNFFEIEIESLKKFNMTDGKRSVYRFRKVILRNPTKFKVSSTHSELSLLLSLKIREFPPLSKCDTRAG